ncbi:MAG: hypothetical protein NTZ09_03170 [Candidatus Hydrogenedentes bacterium]|nr:hypothetical protein [Candidatus Hydrogenedentota bacterium]
MEDVETTENEGPAAVVGVETTPISTARESGQLIEVLANLPEKAILDEKRLASILGVTPRTVRRMVVRFELPPPVRLAGRSVWMVGHILAHIQAAAEHALDDAERQARRLRNLRP